MAMRERLPKRSAANFTPAVAPATPVASMRHVPLPSGAPAPADWSVRVDVPWPATPQQHGLPASASRSAAAPPLGALMRTGDCRTGRGPANSRGTDSPPPPPPRTAATASAAPRRPLQDTSSQRMLSREAPEAKPRRSRHQPHVLDAELQEITFRADLPDVQTAWYESAGYFVSLHPSSARLPSVELPEEVPHGIADGRHLAFAAKPARPQQPRAASEVATNEGEYLCVDFEERLSLRTDRLHTHCVLYLWCRRRSVLSEDTKLLGYRALPLRDATLHGRLAAWDVFSLSSGEEIAHVRLRYSVWTTPGPIQLPHLDEVRPTEVTMHWSPPIDDQGVKVIGYQVSVLGPAEERWRTVSECTNSTSFKLDGLIPGTLYLVDIRAVNEAGVGEPCELEVSTNDLDEASTLEQCPSDAEEIASL